MHADQWQRLRAAYDAALDAPESERPRIVDELAASDPLLAAELVRLLAVEDDDTFDTPLARLAPPRLTPDRVLCDRFVLLRRIGQGGMGEVWAARDRVLQQDVAIKMVRHDFVDAQGMLRLTREIQLARRISHPNVCRVNELFEDPSTNPPRSFLTMELLEGETMAARLERRGPMEPADALEVFRLIVAGVRAAHDARVIHRDLKPANIMLLDETSRRRVAIMDFGLARDPVRSDGDAATAVGTLLGTPEYMAPEQGSGAALTAATDIYALGLILFEMLTGRRPFEGSTTLESWMRRAREGPKRLSGLVPGVEMRIDAVIARCLEYEPRRRFQSAADLLTALDRSFHIAVPRSRRFWVPVAVVLAAVLATVGVLVWDRTRPQMPPPEVLQWYEDAQIALAEGATVRALNDITRALELAPGFAPAHALLAEVQLELDMPGRAQESMLRAAERTRRAWPEPFALHIAGVQALLLRQCDDAIRAFRAVAAIEDRLRPYRMVSAARVMERCDRPDDALALLAEGAVLDPRNAAIPLRQASLFARRQEWAQTASSLGVAEGLFRDRNNVEGVGQVLLLRGSSLVDRDLLDEGEAVLASAGGIARSLQDVRQQVAVLIELAVAARKRGRLDDADRAIERSVQLAREAGLETLTLEGIMASGNARLARSELDAAQASFERALSIAETHRHDELRARAWLVLASVFVRRMNPDRAERALQAARPYYESTKEARNLAVADALLGQILTARAEFSTAAALYRKSLEGAIKAGDGEQIALARLNLAAALVGAAEYAAALEHYRAVAEAYQKAKRPRNLLFTTINIADTLSRQGRAAEADAAFAEVGRAGPLDRDVQSTLHAALAGHALRNRRTSTADREVTRVLQLGAELSRRRTVEANAVRCLARTAAGAHPASLCAATLAEVRASGHVAARVEITLMAAEAMLVAGKAAETFALLREVEPRLSALTDSELRWRLWALLAASAGSREQADAHRAQLTRELDALRLKWRDPMAYTVWAARPDVAALLARAMTNAT